MTQEPISPIVRRFGPGASDLESMDGYDAIATLLERGSCRSFQQGDVDPKTLDLICAAAMSAPSKSDLQQRDIIVISDPAVKTAFLDLLEGQEWIAGAPTFLVVCGNNKRQRRLHKLRGHPFANDHLDAFFNASVDAGIALAAAMSAAELLGLGCCPISAVRNRIEEMNDLLGLPEFVFPVAGLALGHPTDPVPAISPMLSLSTTVHKDRYGDEDLDEAIEAYDARRMEIAPYGQQRAQKVFGTKKGYSWSEDKARQYAFKEREDFGRFVRAKGFDLS